MLKRLHLQNFTVFADADFEFGPGLNVLVGTNGTGKSHVLKMGYAVEAARFGLNKEITGNYLSLYLSDSIFKDRAWSGVLNSSLFGVFLPGQLLPLIRWNAEDKARIEIDLDDNKKLEKILFELVPGEIDNTKLAVIRVPVIPDVTSEVFRPVFIPAKEILTLSWILPGSEQLVFAIEKNYLDLLSQLRLLPLRNTVSAEIIDTLSNILSGEVREEGDKYYLVNKDGKRIAISLVAEGLRKFGTLQKLLANGSLTPQTTLYWDEPEANLNPALLRQLAAILAELARQGFQIILATHSMSLLKEFHILSREAGKTKLPIRYFGLNAEPGQATTVVTQDDFEYLPDIVALEVELEQADDLEEIFAREDRQFHADNRGEE